MQLEIGNLHPWVKNVAEAKAIQEQLRQKVIVSDCLGEVKYVAGVDVGMNIYPLVSVKDIVKIHYGKALKTKDRIESGSIPVFGANGQIGFHDVPLINFPTLVIGRKGSAGEVTYSDCGGWIIDTAFYTEINKPDEIDIRYLFYALKRANLENLTITTSIPGVNRDSLYSKKIPLPPLEEQKRIAAILDKADAIRRKRKEAIALTEELLRSLFLDMFGDPVTNPKGWDVLKLGSQVDELKYGTNAKCSEFQGKEDISVLRIPNIVEEKISWDDLKYAKLESSEVDKLLLKQGDLLFVRSNGNPDYIGRCALFEDERQKAVYASYLIRARLKPDTKFYPAFIRDIVSFPTFRSRLTKEARTTAGNYNINTQGLKSLKLICPPREKQKAYLNFGEKLSERLKVEHNYLEQSTDLFDSLLQKAFRGEL